MTWRYQIGRIVSQIEELILSCRRFPLFRTFWVGRNWEYDLARFAGTRNLGVIFDVGANVGQTCRCLVRFFPRATIHAFEPVSETCHRLAVYTKGWTNVFVHQLALGKLPGNTRIALQKDSQLNSLLFDGVTGPYATGQMEDVTVATADEFCLQHDVAHVDLLKIDAQGADLAVLQGAARLIEEHRVHFVLCEVGFQPDDVINQPFQPLHSHLSAHGLRLCGFYEGFHYGPHSEYLGFHNALYVDPKFSASE